MRIRIIKASKPGYWYSDVIGAEFDNAVPEKMHGQLTGKMLLPDILRIVFPGDYEIISDGKKI